MTRKGRANDKKTRRMSMGGSSPAFKGVGNTLQIILISILSYKKTHLIAVHIQLVR